MKTYNARLADIIAREITNGTLKRFSSLHADAVQEIQTMSNTSCTTTGLRVGDTEASRAAIGREIPDSPASLAAASPARLTAEPTKDSINSGMTCGSQLPAPAAKPVDANHLEGSNQGDHRIPAKDGATGALDTIKNAGGPRGETTDTENAGA